MAITLTEKAAKHIKTYLDKRGAGLGLRLGVRTTGCSGMAYKLEYVDVPEQDDQVYESYDVKIFVDPKSLVYIDGTEPVSYTHLTLPTILRSCRSRWSPYH